MTPRPGKLLLGALLLLAACAPLPTPTPAPSPQVLVVALDPALEPLQPDLAACTPPATALYYAAGQDQPAVRISWGEPASPSAYRYLLGSEEGVIIVHPANPLPAISARQLEAVYAGTLTNWAALQLPPAALTAWTYPPEDSTRTLFENALGTAHRSDPAIQIAANPARLRAAIAADPAAIGILPRGWVDASVKMLQLDGLERSARSRPVLASLNSEPAGSLKALLGCIQQHLSAR